MDTTVGTVRLNGQSVKGHREFRIRSVGRNVHIAGLLRPVGGKPEIHAASRCDSLSVRQVISIDHQDLCPPGLEGHIDGKPVAVSAFILRKDGKGVFSRCAAAKQQTNFSGFLQGHGISAAGLVAADIRDLRAALHTLDGEGILQKSLRKLVRVDGFHRPAFCIFAGGFPCHGFPLLPEGIFHFQCYIGNVVQFKMERHPLAPHRHGNRNAVSAALHKEGTPLPQLLRSEIRLAGDLLDHGLPHVHSVEEQFIAQSSAGKTVVQNICRNRAAGLAGQTSFFAAVFRPGEGHRQIRYQIAAFFALQALLVAFSLPVFAAVRFFGFLSLVTFLRMGCGFLFRFLLLRFRGLCTAPHGNHHRIQGRNVFADLQHGNIQDLLGIQRILRLGRLHVKSRKAQSPHQGKDQDQTDQPLQHPLIKKPISLHTCILVLFFDLCAVLSWR